ncbi:hypothetical protein RND61_03860 [Streptomyces sp. TRM76323]|uniref:Uncharacterized protein n=1 Tax=Streptomyces tamarix TaxID=3078565 RepID=A0ABU3QFN6_9ACTN|nr:hypothetical protein [Streptomyces tamarix]MDT9681214.1 hypothetical protein [Streptomyces tamarix]
MLEVDTEAGPRDGGEPQTTLRHAPTRDESARPPAGGARDGARARERPAEQACDLVTVPARQGLEAVDILRRGAPAVGPVLHDGASDTLGFLVPPGTAAAWDVPGSACTRTDGCGLRLPAGPDAPRDAAPEPPVPGSGWLLPPAETDPVTDPVLLREALDEAARLLKVADDCG